MPRKKIERKPVPIVKPKGFEPLKYLRPDLQEYEEEALWFLSAIREQQGRNKARDNPLYSKILQRHMTERYADIKEDLFDAGVIAWDHRYQIDRKDGKPGLSMKYGLGAVLAGVKWEVGYLRKNRFMQLHKRRQKERDKGVLFLPIHFYLEECLHRITIDQVSADRILDEIKENDDHKAELQRCVMEIVNGYARMSRCPFGRIHSPVVNLASELRPCLRLDGVQNLSIVDVSCCQPLLAGVLTANWSKSGDSLQAINSFRLCEFSDEDYDSMVHSIVGQSTFKGGSKNVQIRNTREERGGMGMDMSHYVLKDVPDDLRQYLKHCEERTLYQHLGAHWNVGEDEAKLLMWKGVMFKETRYLTAQEKVFATLFPTVYQTMTTLKRKDHANYAHLIQRTESNLIINRICAKLHDQYPDMFLNTIHDAIMTTTDCVDDVKRMMKQEFAYFGVNPQLKVEHLRLPPTSLAKAL